MDVEKIDKFHNLTPYSRTQKVGNSNIKNRFMRRIKRYIKFELADYKSTKGKKYSLKANVFRKNYPYLVLS